MICKLNETYFNGAYTVLGMMILGIGLAGVTRATFDKTFTLVSFYATQLKAHPEKAAFTVLLSTLFALIYIPLFIAVFL